LKRRASPDVAAAGLTVYTVGHGARSREAFLRLIKPHGISILVDVRRWPTSKTDHFKRGETERWLKDSGITYFWLGDRLGGYRRGGYREYMKSGDFKAGAEELLRLAEDGRVCIMCLEIGPKRCHRRFITQHLLDAGVNVFHIISEKRVESAKPGLSSSRDQIRRGAH